MIDRYTELTGKSPMLPRFAMGLHVGTYSGGTWKNEEMTSDKYPPALCKRLREEGVPLICFGWILLGGCLIPLTEMVVAVLNGAIRSKIRKPCLIVAMRKM